MGKATLATVVAELDGSFVPDRLANNALATLEQCLGATARVRGNGKDEESGLRHYDEVPA